MSKINVAIIGCGAISNFRHAPEYTSNPDSELIGCYDFNTVRAKTLSSKFGGKVYESVDELLDDQTIDAVSICSSNATHAELTIKALNSGKHVLCEKPMATNIEDCKKMGDTASQVNKILMVGHNQRFAPAHVQAKKILQSGELGRVISFRTTFGHRGPEYWSADKSINTWFFNKNAAFMGATADLGIHKLDLIMWLLDDKVEKVSAFCETLDKKDNEGKPIGVDDNMVSLLKMKKGAIGTLTASWTYYGDEDNSTILFCENGVLRIYDDPDFPIEVVKKDRSRVYYKVGAIQTNDDLVQDNSGVIDAFIYAIKHNETPLVPFSEAVEAMEAIFACLESSDKHLHVEI